MSSAVHKLDRFFFDEQDAISLALVRIIIGVCFLGHYLFLGQEYFWLFGSDGLQQYVFDRAIPEFLPLLLLSLLVVASTFFTVGCLTRTSAIVIFGIHQYFNSIGSVYNWGWATIIQVFVLYSALGGGGSLLSVDGYLRSKLGKSVSSSHVVWPKRLLQFHICAIYIAASLHRLNDPGWLRGEMIAYSFDTDMFSRLLFVDAWSLVDWTRLPTWGAELLEVGAPILLFWRRTRHITVGLLIAMHVTLELSVTTGRWQFMLVAGLLTFVGPEKIRNIMRFRKQEAP